MVCAIGSSPDDPYSLIYATGDGPENLLQLGPWSVAVPVGSPAELAAKAEELEGTIRKLSSMRDGLRHAAACPAPRHM